MKKWWLGFILAPIGVLAIQGQNSAPQIDSIRKEVLRADLTFLASDAMQGRLTATPENRLAAEYIRSRFARVGLKPAAPGGSFYHRFNLATATLGKKNRLEIIQDGAVEIRRDHGQGFYPLRVSSSGRARGPVIFAGYGITSPERAYDDYRDGDVRGKIVLVMNHEPGERDPSSSFDGVVSSQVSSSLQKTLFAQERGAIGILFVRDVHNHPNALNFEAAALNYWPKSPRRIRRFTLAVWMERIHIPAAEISPALAEILIRGSGRSLLDLAQSAETTRGMTAVPIPGPEVKLTTAVVRHIHSDRNVVASLEGSDPRLRDECILVCAHYDHNGADGDRIYNGADDDGSGIIGLLSIADAYARAAAAGQRPRRSVFFAAWNSEERGLLGAWAFTEDPLWPMEKITAVLNMDMIGRNEEVLVGAGRRFRGLAVQTAESNSNAVNIIGTTRSAGLKSAVTAANRKIGLQLRMRYDNNISNLMRRSDHWPFLQRGVPALWFHTGLHPDYHTVYDRPERINYAKMEKVARLVFQMSWNLAQQESRPALAVNR